MKKATTLLTALFFAIGIAQAQDVYFAGNHNGSGKVWKNNTLIHSIADSSLVSLKAMQMATDGSIYTAGYTHDSTFNYMQGRIWRNDSLIFSADSSTAINHLVLGENGWTATGHGMNEWENTTGLVWQNGSLLYAFSDSLANTPIDALAIHPNTQEIYSGGVTDTLEVATIWKNDSILWQEDSPSGICDLYHDGTDLYAAGYFLLDGLIYPTLWQNDSVIFSINGMDNEARFEALTVFDGSVYLAGYLNDSLVVWQDGEVLYGHTFTNEGDILDLVVNEFGVYYAGKIDCTATIWKDGEILYQPEDCDDIVALSVVSTVEPFHTLTVEADSTGWGTVEGGGIYLSGDTATIAAFPIMGAEFLYWNDSITDNPRDIIVTQDSTFIAHFGLLDYLIETSATPENGGTVSGGGTYHYGDTLTLEATPNPGFKFESWNDGSHANPREVIVTQDSTFTASFGICQYTITALSDNVYWGSVTGSGLYNYNDTVVMTATAYLGFEFVGWTDDVTDNPRTIVVTEDHIYTAHFRIQQCLIKADVTPEGAGSVNGAGMYDYGSIIKLTAHSNPGYIFEHWTDGAIENPRNVLVEGDAAYIAEFSMISYEISATCDPEEGGTVSGGGTYHYGDTIFLNASPNTNYIFICWNDGIASNPRRIIVNKNESFTAKFYKNSTSNYTVNVFSNDTTLGTVTGGGSYPEGSIVQINAIPHENAVFTKWNDGLTTNPRSFKLEQDTSFTAYFEPVTTFYTIVVETENPLMGSVYGGGTFPYGTEITIGATANTGFHFVGWQDGSMNNPRTLTVVEDATYTASFDVNPVQSYSVTVYYDENQGFVIGAGTYVEGSTATLAAIPADGYQFVKWGDDVIDNPREIVVDHDIVLAAFFNGTGVDESNLLNISLYPNPANDKLRIEGLEGQTEISIYNALGICVKTLTINGDEDIAIGDLPAGLYVIRIGNGSLKFMKL